MFYLLHGQVAVWNFFSFASEIQVVFAHCKVVVICSSGNKNHALI